MIEEMVEIEGKLIPLPLTEYELNYILNIAKDYDVHGYPAYIQ